MYCLCKRKHLLYFEVLIFCLLSPHTGYIWMVSVADPGSGQGGAENFSRDFANEAEQSQVSKASQY